MDEYEVRKWDAWHRHVTLSMLAHAYLMVLKEAAWAAEEEARRKLREERSAELKGRVQQKIDELEARLGAS